MLGGCVPPLHATRLRSRLEGVRFDKSYGIGSSLCDECAWLAGWMDLGWMRGRRCGFESVTLTVCSRCVECRWHDLNMGAWVDPGVATGMQSTPPFAFLSERSV